MKGQRDTPVIMSVAWRFRRNVALRRSAAMVGVVTMLLVTVYIALQAFTLSGAQLIDRDLGRFEASGDTSQLVSVNPGGGPEVPAAERAANRAGATEVTSLISTFSIDLPQQDEGTFTTFTEGDWSKDLFPDRYVLMDGRWPTRPGEVVLTEAALPSTQDGTVSIFSGIESLDVVGTVDNIFGSGSLVLAAQGTFASWNVEVLAERFPGITAFVVLLWNGGEPDIVRREIELSLIEFTSGETTGAEVALTTRPSLLSEDRASVTERFPLSFNVPLFLLPFLSVVTMFGLNTRRLGRSATQLRSLGMKNRQIAAAVSMAVSAYALGAAIIGCLIGLLLAFVVRPVCAWAAIPPISPFPPVAGLLAIIIGMVAASCAVVSSAGFVRSTRPSVGRQKKNNPILGGRWASIRRGAAGTLMLAGFAVLIRLDSVSNMMILSGIIIASVVLMVPDVTPVALRALPEWGTRTRLSRRQLLAEPRRPVVAVTILTATLAIFAAFATLLASFLAEEQADLTIGAAPGQIVVSDPARPLSPAASEVNALVQSSLPAPVSMVTIHSLVTDTQVVTVEGGGLPTLYVVDKPGDVEVLIGRPLDPTETSALESSEMLDWSGAPTGPRILVSEDFGDGTTSRSKPLQAVATDSQPPWNDSANGVMLASTAAGLGLDAPPGPTVYLDTTPEDSAAVIAAVMAGGFDADAVQTYEAPPPVPVPPALWGTFAGLAAFVLLLVLSVVRAQASTLRGYLGRLVSLGLTSRWARGVLLLELAVVLGLSIVLGLGVAVLSVGLSALRLDVLDLVIPWRWLGLLIGAYLVAAVLAAALGTRQLRPVDRASA